ncbi:MAG: 3-hydroxybutyryl-CoA dehydrogenase [Firmicutes bacterium]|nr:3-hydroxybutyryl-CoA dehydrogenase [Bacillota bacterium]MDH7495514.1 3-hydroxybutyryl-CoA dehydrogenase [Bacillota bacterium]
MNVSKLAVVGAGQMGTGIAQVAATAGLSVVLLDVSEDLARRGLAAVEKGLDRAIEKGKLAPEEKREVLARIQAGACLSLTSDADVAIEAVFERVDVKEDVLRKLDALLPPAAVIASNTSSISITRLASATRRPENVVGMHFMNPVPAMKLVEIISGEATSDETRRAAWELAERMGKVPVAVSDYPGFVANRLLIPMINEAAYCLMEGVASREDIDTVMRLGMNHPMGPLALADLIGLDTCLHIMEVLYEGFRDPKFRPCPLLRRMVDAGHLGRKVGKGFYTY